MATPIPADLRRSLLDRHPEPWVDHLLDAFPPEYLLGFDADRLAGHLDLIRQLAADHPARVRAEPGPDATWRVEVVGYDAFQLLSTVCSLLALHGLSIVEAHIFTSEPPAEEPAHARPRPAFAGRAGPGRGGPPALPWPISKGPTGPDRRRKIVDVFLVRADAGDRLPTGRRFEEELCRPRPAAPPGAARRGPPPAHRPVRRRPGGRASPRRRALCESILLEITPEGPDRPTRVHVRARDSFGFL